MLRPWFGAHTLFAWRKVAGPQVAVAEEGRAVSDSEVLAAVTRQLARFADTVRHGIWGSSFESGFELDGVGGGIALVETAGGVASPGPSGTLQCDLLRPLRLPAVDHGRHCLTRHRMPCNSRHEGSNFVG